MSWAVTGTFHKAQGNVIDSHKELMSLIMLSQEERTKFDRFVDPNVRGAQRRG